MLTTTIYYLDISLIKPGEIPMLSEYLDDVYGPGKWWYDTDNFDVLNGKLERGYAIGWHKLCFLDSVDATHFKLRTNMSLKELSFAK